MNATIRTLIIDDEPLAREGIRLHLENAPDFEIAGECGDGFSAIEAIRSLEPDVAFLDVQMPGIDGFAVLEALEPAETPDVVFITAYDEFALQAFDAHALDYLLKPFDDDRFHAMLDRVRTHLRGRGRLRMDVRLARLLDDLRNRPHYRDRLVARASGRIVILHTTDVDWIEAAANYVRIHAAGHAYLMRETMSNIEQSLDPDAFVRVHRSTIVRIDRIRALEPLYQGDFVVILRDGSRLPTSRGYRDRIQELIGDPQRRARRA